MPRSTRPHPLRFALAAIALLTASGLQPVVAAPAAVSTKDADAIGALSPSIQYEEAMTHANDRIAFEPGARVTTGFRPRATDRWKVGGVSPQRLPAGQLNGAEMRAGDAAGADSATSTVSLDAVPANSVPEAQPDAGAAPASSSNLRREVFGFLPYWELSDSTTTLDYNVLSTIAYFGVGAEADGDLLKVDPDGSSSTGWSGWTSSKMTTVLNNAHANGTRVVLTVQSFAWTTNQQNIQAALLGSAAARTRLAQQTVAAVAARGADGVNLDFEPIVSGYADEFTAFVRDLRSRLDAAHSGYQLTFDTTGYIGNYPIEDATAAGGADAVMIMGYDYRGASSSSAGSISPLTGPVYDLTDTVAAYTARIAPSKVILGVPYYGRAWSTPTDAPHAANISGEKYGYSATTVYASAMDFFASYGRRWDSIEASPWMAYRKQVCTATYGCVMTWRELYVDDAESLKMRYDLVNRTDLRGAGLWALGYDDTRPELYRALADKFLADTTAPLAGVSALAVAQGDPGFIVSWEAWDESTVTSWDVQVAVDGGGWTTWRTGTAISSDVYLGQHGHTYAFRVRATDSHGNAGAWTISDAAPTAGALAVGGYGSVTVDSLAMRAGAGIGATKLGEFNTGDVVAIIGGPVAADGYLWWQVEGPLHEWAPVEPVQVGVWVAATGGPSAYVTPRIGPHVTTVNALILDYNPWSRLVTPNGDGQTESMVLGWTNAHAFTSLSLRVFAKNGTLVETRALSQLGAGPQTTSWDGRVAGVPVADGTYVLQVQGLTAGTLASAPSVSPATPDQATAFGVKVDHQPVTRIAGPDRYTTAALVSSVSYNPGVPVAYIATGLGYADALAGAPVAGRDGGPLLLVPGTSIPAAVAAELSRLAPARIVILGGSGVVSPAVQTALDPQPF